MHSEGAEAGAVAGLAPPAPLSLTDIQPAGAGLRVLVVEHDPTVLALTLEMLEALGHWATGVGSAEAAKTRYLDGAFDVLLTDVGLPGLSGLQLAGSLASRHALPVLVASGQAAPCDPVNRPAWLQKPFDLAQLASALKSVVEAAHVERRPSA